MDDRTTVVGQLELEARMFHLAYPEVWRMVWQEAEKAKNRGFTQYGIAMIWEYIRHNRKLHFGPDVEFKMPNNHRAYYARWYNDRTGETFFHTCRLRSLGDFDKDRYGREL